MSLGESTQKCPKNCGKSWQLYVAQGSNCLQIWSTDTVELFQGGIYPLRQA